MPTRTVLTQAALSRAERTTPRARESKQSAPNKACLWKRGRGRAKFHTDFERAGEKDGPEDTLCPFKRRAPSSLPEMPFPLPSSAPDLPPKGFPTPGRLQRSPPPLFHGECGSLSQLLSCSIHPSSSAASPQRIRPTPRATSRCAERLTGAAGRQRRRRLPSSCFPHGPGTPAWAAGFMIY